MWNLVFGLLLSTWSRGSLAGAISADAEGCWLMTKGELAGALRSIELKLLLDLPPDLIEEPDVTSMLLPLSRQLDLNVLGQGEAAWMQPMNIVDFVVEEIEGGAQVADVADALVDRFGSAEEVTRPRDRVVPDPDAPSVRVGGLVVGEFEVFEDAAGAVRAHTQLNQARIQIGAEANIDGSDDFAAMVEWVPVPERVLHQTTDGVPGVPAPAADDDMSVPIVDFELAHFERAHVLWNQMGGVPLGLMIGQFHLPFGHWNDYTSHRNFTATKGNSLVNGAPLRRLGLGAKAIWKPADSLTLQVAAVQSRLGVATMERGTQRANPHDFATRLSLALGRHKLGASGVMSGSGSRRAVGVDWLLQFPVVSFSGEGVWQQNINPASIYASTTASRLSSVSAYVQGSVEVLRRLSLYGLTEGWSLSADGGVLGAPEWRFAQGARYAVHPQVEWIIGEVAVLFRDSDDDVVHFSSQLGMAF